MKRNKLTRLSFFTMMSELLWTVMGISLFMYLYSKLDPTASDSLVEVMRYYDVFWGKDVPESTLNVVMALSVLVLLIVVPLLVLGIKNYKNIKEEKYDRHTGVFNVIAAVLSVFALNIPAVVLYATSAKIILEENPKNKVKFVNESFERSYWSLVWAIIGYTFLAFLALVIIIPFYWMLVTALMSKSSFDDFTSVKLFLALKDMNFINFKEALEQAQFGVYIVNTLIVAAVTTVGTIITTILAAFAFSRLEFKGRDFIFSVLLMTMMIPGELYVITNFVTISRLEWYNTFYALIVPFVTDVFYIFFLRQAFKQIPDSLYKAAKVDGCSDFKFLIRVMLPIASPTLITITILNALGTWNAYVWPRLVTEENHYLVSIALRTGFIDPDTQMPDYRLQMAAAALITVPILIVFLLARKYIMRGVGRSGTKG